MRGLRPTKTNRSKETEDHKGETENKVLLVSNRISYYMLKIKQRRPTGRNLKPTRKPKTDKERPTKGDRPKENDLERLGSSEAKRR